MPEHFALTSTKMETTAMSASAKTLWLGAFLFCFISKSNFTFIKASLSSGRKQFIQNVVGLEKQKSICYWWGAKGGGSDWFLCPFVWRPGHWFTVWASLLPLTHPFLEALMTYLILEAWEQKLGTGNQLLSWCQATLWTHTFRSSQTFWLYGSRPPCGEALTIQHRL